MLQDSRRAATWAVVLSLSFWTAWARPARSATEKPDPAVVFTKTLTASELFDVLSYPARVTPRVATTILSEADGIVSRIREPLGRRVARGQAILTITHTDPVYQYAPMTVIAPVAGVVSEVDVTEGTEVARGQRLAIVTDPAKVRVDIEVPALDLASLKRGMTGEFRLGSSGSAPVPVRIRGISPFVDPATGTASCELELVKPKSTPDTAPPRLVPGLIGQVSFKADLHSGYSIPESAVVYQGPDTFVRLVNAGKAKQVAVVLGRKERGYVEITKGLHDGDVLIERTSRFVADGEAVTVQSSDSKAEARK